MSEGSLPNPEFVCNTYETRHIWYDRKQIQNGSMFSNGGVLIFMTISTAITLSCSPESFRNYWQNQNDKRLRDVELLVQHFRTTPRQRRWSAPSRACRRRIGSSSARSSDASSTYHQQPAQGWVQWRSPSPRSAPWGSHVQLCRLPSASCWAQMPKCLQKMRRFCELI